MRVYECASANVCVSAMEVKVKVWATMKMYVYDTGWKQSTLKRKMICVVADGCFGYFLCIVIINNNKNITTTPKSV